MDITMMIGGEAGQGVTTAGLVLSKVFARGGYYVFADQDYESRIRGGHNFFRVRISDRPVNAISEKLKLLIALNEETITLHVEELKRERLGGAIVDSDKARAVVGEVIDLAAPLEAVAKKAGGSEAMANSVAVGVALGVMDYSFPLLEQVLREQFPAGSKSADGNVQAARAGYDYARANLLGELDLKAPVIREGKKMFINGNDAIALGALAAGCKFMTSYPMTPSTSIMEFLAQKADEFGLAVIQAEDEISAMNMAIGAAYAGVRAMTATSGGGFCLMVEGLGLAGMTETPVVIVEGQRPGPSTGLPTRTEQGDLEFVLHAAHGEFPHLVLAPLTVEDAFYATVKAFNLAEKYQTPVVILNDHYLASSYNTVDKFDLSEVTADRGLLAAAAGREDGYRRHLITESGISPRAYPGTPGTVVVTTGDEHDEAGHITEDAAIRKRMVEKRLRKFEEARKDIAAPFTYGNDEADILLVGWGSTFGPMKEAVDSLNGGGLRARLLSLRDIYPFPREAFTGMFGMPRSAFVVEQNATAQLAHLIRAETGINIENRILRYDGRPITPQFIAEALKGSSQLSAISSQTAPPGQVGTES
ncbi:MAG: 2-oxoacid:acceptor oxidoreductase subunit alpha [Chloroflexi bacterium]|nr:2-oxoacid:acceptor oxidoreductase subunit alpha [Chloroflexota bacterium]